MAIDLQLTANPSHCACADVELLILLKAWLLMQAEDQKQEYKLEGPNIALHNKGEL